MKIAFIGMGKMGLPMATRLAGAGHALAVFDSSPERSALARSQGLTVFDGIASAVADCDLVFSSLPNDGALQAVVVELCTVARLRLDYVDTSTVSMAASARAATALAGAGIQYLRAPVSGNSAMAEAGALTTLASGPEPLYRRLSPLLALLGPKQFYVGPAEEARLLKLVINMVIAHTSATLAEALTLGRKGGLDWATMWSVIVDSAVGSPIVRAKAPPLSRRDFTPTFTVTQMQKDLGLITDAAAELGVDLPMSEHVAALLASARGAGWADEDYAAVIKVVERTVGLGEPRS